MNFQNMIPDFELRKKIISFLEPDLVASKKRFCRNFQKNNFGNRKTSKIDVFVIGPYFEHF